MSRFADFEEDVVSKFELVADANVVLVHVRCGYILAVCASLVQIWLWRALCLPIRVVLWVVLMHRPLSPAVLAERMFVSIETVPTAGNGTMVQFLVDC